MNPDYVIVGHLSLDQSDGKRSIGGTAGYAARAARLLGRRVGVVTSAPEDPTAFQELFDIEFFTVPSDDWTRFDNEYAGGRRVQTWSSSASRIEVQDVPMMWQAAPIVHLGPIAQEVSPDFALGCPSPLCCATIQGWLRGRSSSSTVLVEVNAELHRSLRYFDVAIVSEEDVLDDATLINELAESARVLILTRGENGCDVFVEGERQRVATSRVDTADATGAGDIFAAAFFVAFGNHPNALLAAQFANKFTGWILQDKSRLDGQAGQSGFETDGQ
ncbi:PfkB family carbohydrate kinase [Bacteroidota bacterium]